MLRKLIILFLIFSLALFAITELVLPPVVARAVQRGLASYLGGEVSSVSLEAHPVMKMLIGKFDKVTVETRNVDVGGLLVDSLTATVNGLSVNLATLVLKHEFQPTWQKTAGLTIKISEANLNRYVWANVPNVSDGHITLEPDKAVVVGNLLIVGQKVPVRAEGRFVVSGDSLVSFETQTVSISGVMLSQEQLALIRSFGGLRLTIDLSRLSTPLIARDITTASGQLTILADSK